MRDMADPQRGYRAVIMPTGPLPLGYLIVPVLLPLLPVVLALRSFRVLPFMVEARAYPWGRRYPATVLLYEVRGREESGHALRELAQALERGEGSPAVAGAERVD